LTLKQIKGVTMKKLIIAAVAAVMVLAVGCGEDETTSVSKDKTTEAVTQTQSVENTDNTLANKENGIDSSKLDSESNDSTIKKAEESSSQADSGEQSESTDVSAIAQAQFEKSCKVQWDFLVNCPYNLDYSVENGDGKYRITDESIKTVDDVVNKYCEVFETVDSAIYEKYSDGADGVYCLDGGRGSNIFYVDTTLEFVSQSDTEAVFKAVSHYADSETGEQEDDKINDFVMVNVDGVWKTRTFTLPY
jgi:hypothetical protein